MRILQLVQKPQRRGAEMFARQLSTELTRQGHELATAYLYPWREHRALVPAENDVVLGDNPGHWLETTLGLRPALLRKLVETIDAFAPDVIQANGGRTLKYGVMARWLRRNSPWLLVYRNIGEPSRWVTDARRRLFYRVILRSADGVIAISRSMLDQLERFYPSLPARTVIPNGIPMDDVAHYTRPPTARRSTLESQAGPIVLFVGSLTREKQPDQAIDVFASLRLEFPHATLWMVGDGPLRADLEDRVKCADLVNDVRFLGVRSDVPSLMAQADALVLLSRTEGIPAVLLEAAMAGLPVVATRVGGVPECVRHEETGLLVELGDRAAAVNALRRVLHDKRYAAQLGNRAREYVRKEFAMTRIAQDYVAFYRSLRTESTGGERREWAPASAPVQQSSDSALVDTR